MGLENISTEDVMKSYQSEIVVVPFNETETLKKILAEIEELEIENTFSLKTTNQNYLNHMEKNYGKITCKITDYFKIL